MPEPAVAAKLCTVCGIDCSRLPRVKDQQGRYMCQECFDKVKHTKHVQKSPPPAATAAIPSKVADVPSASLNDNSFLLDLNTTSKAPDAHGAKVCPECGRGMTASAVICIGCGFNTQSGKRLTLKVEKAKKRKEGAGADAAEVGSYAMMCVVGGLIGGAIGCGIWTAIAHFAQLEIGYVAWAVGGLAGAGCAMGAKGYAGATSGMLAAAIAVAAIVAGKYFATLMLLQKLGFGNVPTEVWFFKMFDFFDILWAVLAVGTAYKVGSADLD